MTPTRMRERIRERMARKEYQIENSMIVTKPDYPTEQELDDMVALVEQLIAEAKMGDES